MKKVEWATVKATDYYGEFEEAVLGKDRCIVMKDNKSMRVKWPDGKTATETVRVVDGSGSAQIDMNGYPDTFDTRRLVVVIRYHGVKAHVPLSGLKIAEVGHA